MYAYCKKILPRNSVLCNVFCRLSEIAEDGHVIVLSHFVTFPNSTSSQPEVMYRRFIQMVSP